MFFYLIRGQALRHASITLIIVLHPQLVILLLYMMQATRADFRLRILKRRVHFAAHKTWGAIMHRRTAACTVLACHFHGWLELGLALGRLRPKLVEELDESFLFLLHRVGALFALNQAL